VFIVESNEAMRRLVAGDAIAMARVLGRSSSLVHKWCEPITDFSASGAFSPLDRLSMMMAEAQRLGRQPVDLYAPIRYLGQGHGVFLPLPKDTCSTNDISRQTVKTIKEFGEALTSAADALEDERLTPNERRKVLKEMDEAVHEMLTLRGLFHE
jgi:hypothetical protein